MGAIADRLAELGIELPEVAAPVAAYVPAVLNGGLLYTSGQLPFVQGALPEAGKVGEGDGLVGADSAKAYARQCALNAIAAAAAVLDGDLDGQHVGPLADRLAALGVPFLFATGYSQALVPTQYQHVPRWEKPFSPQTLAQALPKLLQGR